MWNEAKRFVADHKVFLLSAGAAGIVASAVAAYFLIPKFHRNSKTSNQPNSTSNASKPSLPTNDPLKPSSNEVIPPHEKTPEKVLNFIEGFTIGIGGDAAQDPNGACERSIHLTLDEFEEAFSELQTGFSNVDVTSIEKGLQSLGNGISQLAQVMQNCYVKETVDRMKEIAQSLQSPKGILKITSHELVNVLHHGFDLAHDLKSASESFHSKDYKQAGLELGKIVSILLKQ